MQTVVIYGISLALSSVGASLQACPDLQVLAVDPVMPDTKQRLGSLHPDIIIFDLTAPQPEWMIALWKENPGLLLIGVDLVKSRASVISNQSTRALTTEDLLHVVASHADTDSGPSSQTGPRFPNGDQDRFGPGIFDDQASSKEE